MNNNDDFSDKYKRKINLAYTVVGLLFSIFILMGFVGAFCYLIYIVMDSYNKRIAIENRPTIVLNDDSKKFISEEIEKFIVKYQETHQDDGK